jgi:hypothetical protein
VRPRSLKKTGRKVIANRRNKKLHQKLNKHRREETDTWEDGKSKNKENKAKPNAFWRWGR